MHRELNPYLFGSPGSTEKPTSATPELPAVSVARAQASAPYWPNEVKALEGQVASLKLQNQVLERKVETFSSQLEEFVHSNSARFERVSQAMTRLEQVQAQSQQEMSTQYATIAGRMNERKISDQKIHEMIERHNLIIRNFENRLIHLQRVLTEKERLLLSTQSALEEARQEISRIKRL